MCLHVYKHFNEKVQTRGASGKIMSTDLPHKNIAQPDAQSNFVGL